MVSLLPLALLLSQVPTLEQSIAMKSAGDPQISPDGRFVAYTVTSADWKDNEFRTQIHLVNTTTGEDIALTASPKKSSTSPEWSPDSKRLAFLSDREGKNQIYLIAPTGGEATAITSVETGVSAFHWSPDGKRIAFTSTDPESPERKKRKEKYGDFELVQKDYAMVHLWTISLDTPDAKPERLTQGANLSVGGFQWSPDSKQIAFSATRDPDLSSSHTADIYTLALDKKEPKPLVTAKGPDTNPIWSPDGTRIAYQTANGDDSSFFYSTPSIAIVPANGSAPATLVTLTGDEMPSLIEWNRLGIWFASPMRTTQQIFVYEPVSKKVALISNQPNASAGRPSITTDGTRLAFLCGGANKYTEVCTSTTNTFAAKVVTKLSDQWKDFKPATRELVRWKSKDGAEIEGVLIKPRDFNPAKKYPLLVVIHGGPRGTDRPDLTADRYYPIEKFIEKGALVLRPNYRGSEGYGAKFRALNVRNLGVGDYDDVITGVDHLIAAGYVDKDRVGAMGWSQGGYISAFITCFSDRFQAVSVGAGISDWMTYYVNTDIHPFTRQYLKATPWEDPEIYRKTSPITYVKNAKTPTLIQHGELDKRVPIPNAYELYQALQDKGVPVQLSVFKGFGHGINKPKQALAVLEQNYAFFSEWIWKDKEVAKTTLE
ncbi:peptidase S9 [Bryobacterales bacterium F-183]|nr:peptidase S9 [Bryobacterales bacterium F-183]